MKKITLVTLLTTFVSALPAFAWDPPIDREKWFLLVHTEDLAVSLGFQGQQQIREGVYKVWTRWDFPKDQERQSGRFRYVIDRLELDCTEWKWRPLFGTFYDQKGEVVHSAKVPGVWEEAIPGSNIDSVLTEACPLLREYYSSKK